MDGDIVLLQHQQSKSFIHSVETHASTMTDIHLSSQPLTSGLNGSEGSFFTLVNLPGARDEDAFKILAVPPAETNDTLRLVSYKQRIANFVNEFDGFKHASRRTDGRQTPGPAFDDTDTLSRFQDTLAAVNELTLFCAGGKKSAPEQLRQRQNLFRIHRYIELLVDLMKAPFRKYGGPFELEEVATHNPQFNKDHHDFMDDDPLERQEHAQQGYNSPFLPEGGDRLLAKVKSLHPRAPLVHEPSRRKYSVGTAPTISKSEINTAVMQILAEIVSATNLLLVHIFRGNRENELRIIRFALPTLMELLGNGFQTSLSLSFLLRENRNLVESITAYASIVRNFFELIKTRGKSIRYMQFLVAMCISHGHGVPKTQEAICDLLFNPVNGYRDHVIIPIRPTQSGFDIYVPSVGDQRVLATNIEAIFNKAAKPVSKISDPGKWMPLTKFYEEYHIHGKFQGLGRYCYGLFRLYVALCLDRNYVSIECIQTIFPRDSLFCTVMDSSLSRSLRAILMDLLRVAYVDCEPQKAMTCPNYTRIWTEASLSVAEAMSSLLQTGYSEADATFFLAVIKYCLYYYRRLRGIIAIDATPENELTLAMLRLTNKLVEFGMFVSEDNLSSLVSALFDLLDERTDVIRGSTQQLLDTDLTTKLPDDPLEVNSVALMVPEYQNGAQGIHLSGDSLPSSTPRMRNSIILEGASSLPASQGGRRPDGSSQQYSSRGLVAGTQLSKLALKRHRYRDIAQNDAVATNQRSSKPTNETQYVNNVSSTSVPSHASIERLRSKRHQMNEANHVVMEIKDEICGVLQHIDCIRIDFLMSTILRSYQAQLPAFGNGANGAYSPFKSSSSPEKNPASLPNNVSNKKFKGHYRSLSPPRSPVKLPGLSGNEKISPVARYLFDTPSLDCKFSFSRLAGRRVTTIFMQMLMYEYPPLVAKALELLLREYNHHDELLKELENIQLLVTDETIAIYNKLKDDVDNLRRLAETTEVWMDLTSKSDFEKAKSACQLLRSLTELLLQGDCGSRIDDDDTFANQESAEDEKMDESDSDTLVPLPDVVEKEIPNRKLKYLDQQYRLNPSLGCVSSCSRSHSIFPCLDRSLESTISHTEGGSGSNVSMEARRLLRNLRAAHFVLNMMLDGAHFFEGHIQGYEVPSTEFSNPSPSRNTRRVMQSQQRDQIRAVFSQGMQFLAEFCSYDPQNQCLLAPHVTMIAQYVYELDVAQQLLVAIYAGNEQLYKMVPIELVNIFVTRLIKDGPDPRYLLFLETLTMCGELPILENQLLVIFQLVKAVESAAVLQLFDDSKAAAAAFSELMRRYSGLAHGDENSSQLESVANHKLSMVNRFLATASFEATIPLTIASECIASSETSDYLAVSRTIEYHARLLHLFAACATGKNTRAQEICQQVIPLATILDLLLDNNCTEGMHVAALRYLNQVFLIADETEDPTEELMLRILTVLVSVCESRVRQYLKDTQIRDANKFSSLSLRKKRTARGKMFALPKAPSPADSTTLYVVVHSVLPTVLSFFQQFPRLMEMTGELAYASEMNRLQQAISLLFVASCTKEWKLEQGTITIIEELVYTVDKLVGVIFATELNYRGPDAKLFMENIWASSLSSNSRIDLSGLNLDGELGEILDIAVSEQRRRTSSASDRRGSPTRELSMDRFLAIPEEESNSTAAAISQNDRRNTGSVATRASHYLLTIASDNQQNIKEGSDSPRQQIYASPRSGDALSHYGNAVVPPHEFHAHRSLVPEFPAASNPNHLKDRVLHKILPARYVKKIITCWQGQKPTDIDHAKAHANGGTGRERRRSSSVKVRGHSVGFKSTNSAPVIFNSLNTPDDRTSSWRRSSASSPTTGQRDILDFAQFYAWLREHPRVDTAIRDELNRMVQGIVGVEAALRDEYDSQHHLSEVHLTFDLVVRKLVAHVAMFQDTSYLKMNVTLLDVFCRMIYAIEDADLRHKMQVKLNKLGVTRLVVQLIAKRDNDLLFSNSISVGVALLDGMNAEVQESFYSYWRQAEHAKFFEHIQRHIEKACTLVLGTDRYSGSISTLSGSPPPNNEPVDLSSPIKNLLRRNSTFAGDLRDSSMDGEQQSFSGSVTSIFRFLQLLCEGHYLNAQRSLIAQPFVGSSSVNLVESTTSFLLDTYLTLGNLDVGLLLQLFQTIAEFCQGPCEEAQETVANYKFINAVNTLLTQSFVMTTGISRARVRQVRGAIVITLLSLLEGRRDLVIHAQLVQELNFEALKAILVEVYAHFLQEHGGQYAGNLACSTDSYLAKGFNVYFLLQQLADHFPHAAHWIPRISTSRSETAYGHGGNLHHRRTDTVDYRAAYAFFQTNSTKVEVVWDDERAGRSSNLDSNEIRPSNNAPSRRDAGIISHDALSLDSSSFIDQNASTVSGALIPFYFPLHPICFCLTEQSKKKLVWQVSRGPDKLSDFFHRCDKLVDEMGHQSLLMRYPSVAWFARQSDQLKRMSFMLAVGINLVVLLFYRADGIDSYPYAGAHVMFMLRHGPDPPSEATDVALSVAGSIQLVLCSMVLMCYLINSAPLLIKKGWKRRIQVEETTMSKKNASRSATDASDTDDRDSFQDTEQLLRSLREREEEYDYFFLPREPVKRRVTQRGRNSSGSLAAVFPSTQSNGCGPEGASNSQLRGPSTTSWLRFHHQIVDFLKRSEWVQSRVITVAISLYFLVRNPRVLYYMLQITIAILGSYINKLFFAFHLLDVINRYQDLNNVLRSIARPAKVLALTVLLYLVVVYVFAIVGFYFFREDYTPAGLTDVQRRGEEPYQCQQLFQCFLVSLDQGFKSNGGLGGYLKANNLGDSGRSFGRLAFDLLYNTILMIMLLNIVFGVIIDTFASLRTADSETITDMQNRCFICSIDAYTFDRATTKRGFHDHIYADHNMWHYLFLFVHIRKKPITEYNGLELYLAMRMAKKDVSFFPVQRALALERSTSTITSVGLRNEHHGQFDGASDESGDARRSIHIGESGSEHDYRSAFISLPGTSLSRSSSRNNRFQSSQMINASITSRSGHVHQGSVLNTLAGGGAATAAHRATNEKLEKLEITVETLLATQTEMREELMKSAERQRELVHALSTLQDHLFASSMKVSSNGADDSNPESNAQLEPILSLPRAPVTDRFRASPDQLSLSERPRSRSLTRPSNVFNFDSVVGDDDVAPGP